MNNELLNKVITISGKEEKLQGGKPVIKLKDERNLTYTVYKTKQDGTVSAAWEQLEQLNLGDTVQIGFVEQQGEFQGKPVTYRTIRNFNKDIGNGVQNHQNSLSTGQNQSQGYVPTSPVKSFNTEANRGTRNESSEDFGKRLAIHGMVNGMLAAGAAPGAIDGTVIQDLLALESRLDAFLNPSGLRQAVQAKAPHVANPELPTIQQNQDMEMEPDDNDVNVEEIPF